MTLRASAKVKHSLCRLSRRFCADCNVAIILLAILQIEKECVKGLQKLQKYATILHMTHELTYRDHESAPGRLQRVASGIGNFILKKTSGVRTAVAGAISPELASEARLASFDVATGLPNRRAMQRRFEELSEDGVPFGTIMIDIDKFKLVNTLVGHEYADDLFKKFADRLNDSTRESDILAIGYRTGGDEFIIIAPLQPNLPDDEHPDLPSDKNVKPLDRLNALMARLQSSFCNGVDLESPDGRLITLTATMAGVVIEPSDPDSGSLIDYLNGLSQEVTSKKEKKSAV